MSGYIGTRIAKTDYFPATTIVHPVSIKIKDILRDFNLTIQTQLPLSASECLHNKKINSSTDLEVDDVKIKLQIVRSNTPYCGDEFTIAVSVEQKSNPVFSKKYQHAAIKFRTGKGNHIFASDKIPDSSFYLKSLLHTALSHAAAIGGSALLHSAAFRHKGTTFLFVGNSCSGKSTLCAFAMEQSGQIFSDDLNLVTSTPQGTKVNAFRKYFVFRQRTWNLLPEKVKKMGMKVKTKEGIKYMYTFANAHLSKGANKIDVLVFPSVGNSATKKNSCGFEIESITRDKAVQKTFECLDTSMMVKSLNSERQVLQQTILGLVQGVPSIKLNLYPDFLENPRDNFAELANQIESLLQEYS